MRSPSYLLTFSSSHAPQPRFAAPRGSVLIMVIAILVLMALIGTAFVSVARIDRQASATGSNNTQNSMLTAGVAQQVDALILNSLFDHLTNYYRPMPTVLQVSDYHHYDSPLDDRDAWLASRVPQYLDVNNTAIGASNPIVWPAVSMLWNNSTPALTDAYSVDDPSGVSYSMTVDSAFNTGLKFRYRFEPTDKIVGAVDYPAMAIYTLDTSNFAAKGADTETPTLQATVLAADADGDGIADALYFKLPNQPDSGITYYGAVRVVDNNSAINASTAWTYSSDLMGSGTVSRNWGFFHSNVGLEEMLRSYIAGTPPKSMEMQALDQYRLSNPALTEATLPSISSSSAAPYDDPSPSNSYAAIASSPYQFLTYGDLFEMQLDRRPDNAGFDNVFNALSRPQPLSWGDNASLAYRFCLARSSGSSTIESDFSLSLTNGPGASVPTQSYISSKSGNKGVVATTFTNAAGDWYYDNFDYDDDVQLTTGPSAVTAASFRPRRALLVGRNPVSDNAPWDINVPWYGSSGQEFTITGGTATANLPPSRANLNTGQFTELQNAFLGVMDHCDNILSPFQAILSTVATGYNITGVAGTTFVNTDVQKLRAALAAINTVAMRRQTYTSVVTSSALANAVVALGTSPSTKAAYVYAAAVQPYITEAVVYEIFSTAGINGTSPYFGMKIYNPYASGIDMTNWQLVSYNPSTGAMSNIYTFSTSTTGLNSGTLNAGTSLYLYNNNTLIPKKNAAVSATSNPVSVAAPPSSQLISVSTVEGLSFLLLRPVTSGGSFDVSTPDPTKFAPVDQVDCTQLADGSNPALNNSARLVYYVRPATSPGTCIYAGRDGNYVGAPAGTTASVAGANWTANLFALGPDGELDTDLAVSSYNAFTGTITWTSDTPTVNLNGNPVTISLPLNSLATFPSPNPVAASGNKFPFGGFARDGDAFKIPFIGGYVVMDTTATPPKVVAVSGISYDAAYAEDRNGLDDASELIGQFCPIAFNGNPTNTLSGVPAVPDDYYVPLYQTTANIATAESVHRYYFARFLLDYVGAVSTPNDDEAPNIDPLVGTVSQSSIHDVPNNANYFPSPLPQSGVPTNWANHGNDTVVSPNVLYNNECAQPNEGLININTAPWPVLAMLPMSTDANGTVNSVTNVAIAKAIVAYRDRNGPFTSAFDLNRVVNYAITTPPTPDPTHAFYSGWVDAGGNPALGSMNTGDSVQFGPYQQDCTNLTQALTATFASNAGATTYDYYQAKDRLNMLTRISNLITTRSDSFTVYIVVEGWKNAGTATATRVSQVRQAYIADRSHVNGLNKTLNIIPVPN